MAKIEPQDMSLKFGGRVLHFAVFANTSEDEREVTLRLSKAARGQMRAAVVTTCAVHEGEEAAELWAALGKETVRVAADPRVEIVDADGVRQIDAEADAAADKPPPGIDDFLQSSMARSVLGPMQRLMPDIVPNMIGMLVQQVITKLPRDKQVEAVRYLAELVWPGSTRK